MAGRDKTGILLESGTNELELIEVYIDEEGGYRGYYGVNVAKVLEIISLPSNLIQPVCSTTAAKSSCSWIWPAGWTENHWRAKNLP
jgi:chemotaxis signal transduction protein